MKHKESIGENCQNGIFNAKISTSRTLNVPVLSSLEFTGSEKNIVELNIWISKMD